MSQMYRSYLVIIFFWSLFIRDSNEESILSIQPNSINLYLGHPKNVAVHLEKCDLKFPVTVDFLYDDSLNSNDSYIEPVPHVIFLHSTDADQSQDISIIPRRIGHMVLTAQSMQINSSLNNAFLRIDIARNKGLDIFIQIVGWIYFVAWSISFYPQIYLNFVRRSVVGLNFDFLALNILGHSCYSVFNLVLYTSYDVQEQYYQKHPHGVLPVLLNDVIFSCHAVAACLVTIIQCLIFERGPQRVSHIARVLGGVMILFLTISTIISLAHHLPSLTLIYFFSYVKLAITIIKYMPQARMNCVRKSTEGWSIGNILLDFTGGILSILQMFLLAINYDDWSSIFGSPTKFGLGLFSVLFDLLFMVQHYCLYSKGSEKSYKVNDQPGEVDEKSPMLHSTA